MNSKKLELIRQLLAKAESTTPEEAEALTEAAAALMARHGIDEAMIAASDPGVRREQIVSRDYFASGQYARAVGIIAQYVVNAFPAQKMVITAPAREYIDGRTVRGERITVVGFESEVDHTIFLLASLNVQAMTALNAWWKTVSYRGRLSASEKFLERRQFLFAFGAEVGKKIEEAVAVARRDVEAETGSSTALVLADRSAEVASEYRRMFPRVKNTGRRLRTGSMNAEGAGREAGRAADIGSKGVGQRRRIGA